MTEAGKPQVVVLCEDRKQYHFVRKYLQLHGVTRIIQRIFPPATGSAEAWVRRQYPREVKAHRAKRGHLNIALAVVTDADRYTVDYRKGQLDTSLTESKPPQESRQDDERIAVFVPKWSVETWFRFLDGASWDEETSYRDSYWGAAPSKYARRLFDGCRDGELPGDPPLSLSDACSELPRLAVG